MRQLQQPKNSHPHNGPPRTGRRRYWFLLIIAFGTPGLRTEFITSDTTRLEYLGARLLPFARSSIVECRNRCVHVIACITSLTVALLANAIRSLCNGSRTRKLACCRVHKRNVRPQRGAKASCGIHLYSFRHAANSDFQILFALP